MHIKVVITGTLLLAGLTFASNNIFKFEQKNVIDNDISFGNKETHISNSPSETAILNGDEHGQRTELSQSEKNDPPSKCGYRVRINSF